MDRTQRIKKVAGKYAARAKKLDERWKAEIAEQERKYAEAQKRLTADASAAWPKIAAAVRADDGLNPSDAAAAKGKIVRLKGVPETVVVAKHDRPFFSHFTKYSQVPSAGLNAASIASGLGELIGVGGSPATR